MQPRTFIFGGKAAPGYHLAKLMIKLITSVGEVVNRDPQVRDRLKVVFLPNFNVTNGQRIYPAADLSEQISTAGKEASGTGNMKFCMNGALTIGTLDGANIEICNEVGAENFFMFGLLAPEVYALKARGYRPAYYYETNPELRDGHRPDLARASSRAATAACSGRCVDGLMHWDPYLRVRGFPGVFGMPDARGPGLRRTPSAGRAMSILNAARSGNFSSDRTIREYVDRHLARAARADPAAVAEGPDQHRDASPLSRVDMPMRAAVFHGREDLRLEDVPEPAPRAGEVKLRVLYNGICGSDLHEYYHGPITTRTTPHPLTGIKNPVIIGPRAERRGHRRSAPASRISRSATGWPWSPWKPAARASIAAPASTTIAGCSPSTATTAAAAGSRSSRW